MYETCYMQLRFLHYFHRNVSNPVGYGVNLTESADSVKLVISGIPRRMLVSSPRFPINIMSQYGYICGNGTNADLLYIVIVIF